MAQQPKLHHPWLVAVWPGMGQVALNAGYYLLTKLEMNGFAEFEAQNLFDVESVEVKHGIVQAGVFPRNRFFVWKDPFEKHDLVVFIGEAQPPVGKYAFCRKLIEFAKDLGVERVFTFAAMATGMHPAQPSRVFAVASEEKSLEEFKRLEVQILDDGNIGGLNGVLLGAAVEADMKAACLLGEMPQVFSQLAYPKPSLAILEVFTTMAGIAVDLTDLSEQVEKMDEQLGELMTQIENNLASEEGAENGETSLEPEEEEKLAPDQAERIEHLFAEAAHNRAKAFELKQSLDSLGVFKEYEDRFLDLFKKPHAS